MRLFVTALRCEMLKARRSKVPLLTGAGFSLAPLMAGLFIFILKDPARARTLGLIGAKAQITTGVADWPTFLGVIAQATAVGGYVLFALVTSWVFGREFADRTLKLVLAIPTPRHAILAAKFLVLALWSALLCAWVFAVGIVVGLLIGLPAGSGPVVWAGALLLWAIARGGGDGRNRIPLLPRMLSSALVWAGAVALVFAVAMLCNYQGELGEDAAALSGRLQEVGP